MIDRIVNIFEDTADEGADTVRQAIAEMEEMAEDIFHVQLGEPYIPSNGNKEYFNDPKIVVPIHGAPFVGDNRLIFDLPESRGDDLADFNRLLRQFDLEFETMENLQGEEVPLTYEHGNPVVLWQDLADDSEKGAAGDSGGSVNVEQTTVASNEGADA